MGIEDAPKQEQAGPTPKQELKYAEEALEKGDWGEVEDCVNQLSIKAKEAVLSEADKEGLKARLEKLKSECEAKGIPEERKGRLETFFTSAENVL